MAKDKAWYDKMAAAVNDLRKAENGITRWEEKRDAAQAVIDALATERETPEQLPLAEEQVAEALPAVTPPFIPPVTGGDSITIGGTAPTTIGPVFSVTNTPVA